MKAKHKRFQLCNKSFSKGNGIRDKAFAVIGMDIIPNGFLWVFHIFGWCKIKICLPVSAKRRDKSHAVDIADGRVVQMPGQNQFYLIWIFCHDCDKFIGPRLSVSFIKEEEFSVDAKLVHENHNGFQAFFNFLFKKSKLFVRKCSAAQIFGIAVKGNNFERKIIANIIQLVRRSGQRVKRAKFLLWEAHAH